MAKYSEWRNYFEQIAIEHVVIQHSSSEKTFFAKDIEELFANGKHAFPGNRPFLVFINYITDRKHTSRPVKDHDMMFFVLKQHQRNDVHALIQARDETEEITDDILRRMKHDSQNDLAPVFEHSFDKINGRTIPLTLPGNTPYSGWQTTFKTIASFNDCFDATKWNQQ